MTCSITDSLISACVDIRCMLGADQNGMDPLGLCHNCIPPSPGFFHPGATRAMSHSCALLPGGVPVYAPGKWAGASAEVSHCRQNRTSSPGRQHRLRPPLPHSIPEALDSSEWFTPMAISPDCLEIATCTAQVLPSKPFSLLS